MKAMFVVAKRKGDGKTIETAWTPWYIGNYKLAGWATHDYGEYFAGNIFHVDQSILDAITTDLRTEFAIPIEVHGKKLGWKNKDDDLPASLHGKIVSWIAKAGLHKLDSNMKKPGQIAKHIMSQVSEVEGVDPLNGFRVHWSE